MKKYFFNLLLLIVVFSNCKTTPEPPAQELNVIFNFTKHSATNGILDAQEDVNSTVCLKKLGTKRYIKCTIGTKVLFDEEFNTLDDNLFHPKDSTSNIFDLRIDPNFRIRFTNGYNHFLN